MAQIEKRVGFVCLCGAIHEDPNEGARKIVSDAGCCPECGHDPTRIECDACGSEATLATFYECGECSERYVDRSDAEACHPDATTNTQGGILSSPDEGEGLGLPRGWTTEDPFLHAENRPVACSDCDWTGRADDLVNAGREILDGLTPGGITPVGRCPECIALVFFSDVQVVWRPRPSTPS
jgi:hypothetical protein